MQYTFDVITVRGKDLYPTHHAIFQQMPANPIRTAAWRTASDRIASGEPLLPIPSIPIPATAPTAKAYLWSGYTPELAFQPGQALSGDASQPLVFTITAAAPRD